LAKISALTDGAPAVGTDVVAVARGAGNRRLTLANLISLFFTSPTITGAVTSTGATGIPTVLSVNGIPFIKPASGTMGNNGAFTNGTALPLTYAGGAWCWFAADQIAAGVGAGWYWSVWSSTTAATIYNNTYSAGQPVVGTTTAFVTTGPGAITGVTAEVFGPTITIPAASITTNGGLRLDAFTEQTSNANVKTIRFRASGSGGTAFASWVLTSRATGALSMTLMTRGAAARNYAQSYGFGDNNALSQVVTAGTVDFSASTTGVLSVQGATATDNIVIEAYTMELVR
jgi:hypothetical protein